MVLSWNRYSALVLLLILEGVFAALSPQLLRLVLQRVLRINVKMVGVAGSCSICGGGLILYGVRW